MISQHLDKNNLHHAYLIEGAREEAVPEITEFIESLGVKTVGNQDFFNIALDKFSVEDARNLKSYGSEKAISLGHSLTDEAASLPAQAGKKIFIISANNFLLEAQNVLLKIFEEPTEGTHFFIIVPDTNALLPTFVSRFYLIKTNEEIGLKEAEKFIGMPITDRIDFIKELLAEDEAPTPDGVGVPTESVGKDITLDSARSRALKFLNVLESALHNRFLENSSGVTQVFNQIFKVRKFLRQPGSSAKSLMESVALILPPVFRILTNSLESL